MSILSWVILGVVSGLFGSKLANSTGDGILHDIFLGVIGALVGGTISNLSMPGADGITAFNLGSLVVAVIGASLVLFIRHTMVKRRPVRR
jgi:uncharacterized membrane protein YeaQ/YmgE (transglycosylase-associated protein family)